MISLDAGQDAASGLSSIPDFLESMRELLGEEYPAFLESLSGERKRGLRLNTLKLVFPDTGLAMSHEAQGEEIADRQSRMAAAFFKDIPFHLTPLEAPAYAYTYPETDFPGKHPLHEAGAYYLQDPDAMRIAPMLAVRPGERVLDLCAAPGGKASQLAAAMNGDGLLFANEIHPERAGVLAGNLERLGVRNAVVFNEKPEKLADRFPLFFDKILVDAPCSGEGMFRKDPEAIRQWSPENVEKCVLRQHEILDAASRMLSPGGLLAYSTCTFNRRENEEQVELFLDSHPDFSLLQMIRLFPHRSDGEGHFGALLKRKGERAPVFLLPGNVEEMRAGRTGKRQGKRRSAGQERAPYAVETVISGVNAIAPGFLLPEDEERFVFFGERVYLSPKDMPALSGLRVISPGLALGQLKKGVFIPAHGLAMALLPQECESRLSLADEEVLRYLKGEELSCPPELSGFVPLFYRGFSTGFGKAVKGRLKNHYPKGLRKSLGEEQL